MAMFSPVRAAGAAIGTPRTIERAVAAQPEASPSAAPVGRGSDAAGADDNGADTGSPGAYQGGGDGGSPQLSSSGHWPSGSIVPHTGLYRSDPTANKHERRRPIRIDSIRLTD